MFNKNDMEAKLKFYFAHRHDPAPAPVCPETDLSNGFFKANMRENAAKMDALAAVFKQRKILKGGAA